MHLSKKNVDKFYRIWMSLIVYVNDQKSIIQRQPVDGKDILRIGMDEVAKIREVLWENTSLIDGFVEANPDNLSDADLDTVISWKNHVTGSFYIFRHLRNGTVFLDDDKAYSVLGITNGFDEIFGHSLPIYIQTTLIPFDGKIIYDSLVAPYNASFGSGIKESLKQTYKRIQEREGIITNLTPTVDPEKLQKQVENSNSKVLRAFERDMGKSGLSAKKMLEHKETIATFANNFMLKTDPLRYLLDIEPSDVETYFQNSESKINHISFKRFARFLRDTYRINPDEAQDLLDTLKNTD